MTKLIEKYFRLDDLQKIVRENNYDHACTSEFMYFIDLNLQEHEKVVDDDEDPLGDIMSYTLAYMRHFVEIIKEGYSLEWSRELARARCMNEIYPTPDDEDEFLRDCYDAINEVNPEKAIEDLKLYCRKVNADELFEKHFLFLMKDVQSEGPPPNRQAAEYSRIFKEQINNGKSEKFAHVYADYMAEQIWKELYCFSLAEEYTKALDKGFSEKYAMGFAMDIADYIVDHFKCYDKAQSDLLFRLEREKLEKKN